MGEYILNIPIILFITFIGIIEISCLHVLLYNYMTKKILILINIIFGFVVIVLPISLLKIVIERNIPDSFLIIWLISLYGLGIGMILISKNDDYKSVHQNKNPYQKKQYKKNEIAKVKK